MAKEVQWIKIVTDVFEDEKIILIDAMPKADSILIIWFKLLCFAGKQNNGGVFLLNEQIPYTDLMLAQVFRRPVTTVRKALDIFEQYGMITREKGVLTLPNWNKHQSLDSMAKRREYMKELMANKRKSHNDKSNDNGANKNTDGANNVLTVSTTEVEVDTDTDTTTNVVVVEEENIANNDDDDTIIEDNSVENRMQYLGTLGKGVVMLSPEQIDILLDRLSLDEFNYYVSRLADFIINHPGATIKSHYKTILKWANEDRQKN